MGTTFADSHIRILLIPHDRGLSHTAKQLNTAHRHTVVRSSTEETIADVLHIEVKAVFIQLLR